MTSQLLHPMEAAAAALGVGRTTVYNLAARGDLRTVHIGRRALVTDESLRAYVERLTRVSAPASDGGGEAA
jgi:excisionase family DNA binding protein